MKSTDVLVEFNQVDFSQGDTEVFKDFHFQWTLGQALALKGHNGTGKTTLIRLILGGLVPKKGSILYGPSWKKLSKIYLPDEMTLPGAWTLRESLEFQEKALNLKSVDDFISKYSLEAHLSKKLCDCSQGTRHKSIIYRIYTKNESCFLLDEPTRYIDLASKKVFLRDLSESLTRGCSLLCVTHHEEEIKALGLNEFNLDSMQIQSKNKAS